MNLFLFAKNCPPATCRTRRLSAWAWTLGLLLPASLPAQTTMDDQDVVELPPFEVYTSEDRGYRATSSFAGGRISTPLRDTAASISVMTGEFIRDIGAANFLEAAKWAPNAVSEQEVSGRSPYNDYSIRFRGMDLGFQSRNYVIWYINSDAYNTERIDFSRGPNSLVFGDAGAGGIANVSSIQARGTGKSKINAQYSSFGGFRTTVDTDLKVNDSLSVRGAAVYQKFDDWRSVGHDERYGVFLTATYKLMEKMTLRAEIEYGEVSRLITFGALDAYSNWDGSTTVSAAFPSNNNPYSGKGITRQGDRLVFTPGREDQGVVNWVGWGAVSGTFR